MKNKNILIVAAVIVVLAASVTLFALLNAGETAAKQQSQDNATVTVNMNGESKTFNLRNLKTFEKTEFSAAMDTSKSGPEQKSFGGVALVTVLNDLGFKLDEVKQVVFKAADGYTSAVTAEEAADPENIYVVYERDGQPSGTKQQGGSGPIEIVIRKDAYSQRWCKYLMEIDIE